MPDHVSWITLSLLFSAFFSLACAQSSLCGDGSKPQLAFKPTKLVLNDDRYNNRSVSVTCRQPVQGVTHVSLALNRTLDRSSSPKALLFADKGGNKDLSGMSGTSIAGNFNTSVVFTMPKASCEDARQSYTCEATFNPSNSPRSVFCLTAGRLNAVSEPKDVKLSAEPDTEAHSAGDTLTLTCSATVGLKMEETRAEWVWEVKEEGKSWTTLKTNIYLSKLKTLDDCLLIRSTVFKINLRESHDGTSYRCYLTKEGETFTDVAGEYKVKVDSFIFGLKTSHGAVVLAGIFIILLAIAAAVFVGVRHYMRYHINQERTMYRERVMNRLDKLFRFEEELIGGVMKKRKSLQPVAPPEPTPPPETPPETPPPPPPPEPKKRLEDESETDPTEITIQLQMPKRPPPAPPPPPLEETEFESDVSDVESEAETDVSESDVFDPTGPMHKV